ncbi:MAG: alpha/beta hydrolase family esterase, partial [Rhodothermales bacterium]
LVIPPRYDPAEARPLLFAFHGGGLSMAAFFNMRKDLIQRCEEENWILVFPNGSNTTGNRGSSTWNAAHCCGASRAFDMDDIGFVSRMIDTVSVMVNIDANRIYATGGSNGGMFTHRLAAEMPDVFAAVAPSQATIGGQVDSLSPVVTVQPAQPIPIMMIHGRNDQKVRYNGGLTGGGSGRIDLSFRESVLFWANNNGCTVSQGDTTVVDGLNGKVWMARFAGCDANREVRGVTIQNYGHGWPSLEESGFDGTNAMVDFLKQFSK